jgi:hypothetical protein
MYRVTDGICAAVCTVLGKEGSHSKEKIKDRLGPQQQQQQAGHSLTPLSFSGRVGVIFHTVWTPDAVRPTVLSISILCW